MNRILNINKYYFLLASLIVISLRLLVVIIFPNSSAESSIFFFLGNFSSSIFALFFALFLVSNFNRENLKKIDPLNSLNTDIIILLLSYFGLILLYLTVSILGTAFLGIYYEKEILTENRLTLVFIEILSASTNIVLIYSSFFLVKWSIYYRFKKTKLYFIIIIYYLLFWITINSLKYYFSLEIPEFVYFVNTLAQLYIIYIVWSLNSKNYWVYNLESNDKKKLLSILVFLNILILVFILFFLDIQFVYKSLSKFNPITFELISLVGFSVIIYNTRIIIPAISSLLTSGYVERRTTEVSSLTYLNKLMAESVDKDISYFIKVVTDLALQASEATYSWTEVYDKNGKISIASSDNIDDRILINFIKNSQKPNIFKDFDETLLIDSVPENTNLSFISEFIPYSQSLIIVPLYDGLERFGTLIVSKSEEFGFETNDIKILEAFGNNVSLALENSRLVKDSIEKERIKKELLIAQNIQSKLLPGKLPYVPTYTLDAFSITAKEVGGDYYDFVKLKSGEYCLVIGDVSGKGMSAAFYMAQLKGVVISHSEHSESPYELVCKINSTLHGKMDKQIFITLSAVSFDESGNIKFVRAGHMPLLLEKNQEVQRLIPKGIGIGLTNDKFFREHLEEVNFKLEQSEKIIVFTDGVNEFNINENEELGIEPIEQLMIDNKTIKADELTQSIKNLFKEHPNNEIIDDMTLVCLIKNNILEQ